MTLPLGQALFFGVWGCGQTGGHNLHLPDGNPHYVHRGLVKLPEALAVWKLDSNFCRDPEYRIVDSRAHAKRDPSPQNQSEGFLVHQDGWTLLAVWDRTGDSRPNSNAVFLVAGEHAFEAVLALAEQEFPQQLRRIQAAAPIRIRNLEWVLS